MSIKAYANDYKAIVCTQPRRVAAVNVSGRVAEELGCLVGEEVGYNVRFHTRISSKTVIKYCTDGVLIRETLSDPLLSKYSVVMVDEAHEQSMQSDLLLGILKKIMKKRHDLRVIITSATIKAEQFIDYFTSDEVLDRNQMHILPIQGRQYAVDIFYLSKPISNYIKAAVDTAVSIHRSQSILSGDILVFLPGSEEIDRAIDLLNDHLDESSLNQLIILPLHSSMPSNQQMAVFDPTPPNYRKIVFATNIAETSVTIEGIAFVIDCGFVKLNYFQVNNHVEYLVTCSISQASANQRAGRAGRTAHGICYRLYTEASYTALATNTPSEMQRMDISWTVLQLKAIGISNVLRFDYLNSPSSEQMIYALEFLYSLGAIDEEGEITALGEKISEMSIDIRLAKCLLSSYDLGCSEEMLSIAAMCSVEYPYINLHRHASPEAKKRYWDCISEHAMLEGDHLTLLNIYRSFQEHDYAKSWSDSMNLQHKILARAKEIRAHLQQMLLFYLKNYHSDASGEVVLSSCGSDSIPIRKALAAGYFANAARLGSDGHYHTIRGQTMVTPHSSSIIANYGALPEWIIFHEAIYTKDTPQMREISKIDPMWLLELAPHYYKVNKSA
jgi:ATP-dependent RNA helicase DDX35